MHNAQKIFMGQRDVAAIALDDPARYRVPHVGDRPRVVFSSPLQRARAAADVLFPTDGARLDARLVERGMGELEGLDHHTVRARWPESFVGDAVNPRFAPPGGESLDAFAQRVAGFLQDVFSGSHDGDVYVVTHNGWIRMARYLSGELALDELFTASVPFLEPALYLPDLGRLAERLVVAAG